MVAADEHRPHAMRAVGAKPLDDLGRSGTAVDEIAEKDNDIVGPIPALDVGLDPRQRIVDQIQPAMNVADRIDAIARRHARLAGAAVLGKETTKQDHGLS